MNNQLINYKGIELKQDLLQYFKHMFLVEEYREELVSLSKSWDNLSLLSNFGNNSANINETKNNFSKLTSKLLNHLSNELLEKTIRQMKFKSQISIDILIRNLYERTADIGFLSTDKDIREFLENNKNKYDNDFTDNVKILRNRFLEYTQKYSVYYNIVLMDTKGNILVQLDKSEKISKSEDEILELSLSSNDYVESFKFHDFIPSKKKSLVYASKVTKTNDPNSESIGVLCLCFKFQDEMKGIFNNLKETKNKECLTILDKDGVVIATSDKYHVNLGTVLDFNPNSKFSFISHGGRDYLVKTCKTNGYQGYFGQEWYGHILLPLDYAFVEEDDNLNIDQDILLAILQGGERFSDELKKIPLEANNIQENLNRLVWNGNLNRGNQDKSELTKSFSRALLNEISLTGEKTKKIFDLSIANLTKTIILNNATYVASLMVDIMDRNLYERANDCRWWALTQDFKDVLTSSSIDKTNNSKLTEILSYINSLYTVYTNLFIYDKNGIILAVSKEEEKHLVGMQLNDNTLENTMKITDNNDYFVSNFKRTKFYNDDYTYIYYSSIKSNENVVGGIGVVFDSKVELKAMLEESIPNFKSSVDEKRFGVFTDKKGLIISSTNEDLEVGTTLDIDLKFFNMVNGESHSEIIVYNGNYYAIGIKCSQGYREYKVADNYSNDIFAIFFSYISSADLRISHNKEIFKEISGNKLEDTQEIGTFFIGGKWLGIEIENLIEVVSIVKLDLSPTMNNDHYFKGTIIYNNSAVGVIDIKNFLDEKVEDEYKEVVIIKHFDKDSENYIGILVNELGDIPEVPKSRIKKIDNYLLGNCTLINSVIVPLEGSKDDKLLSILDIEMLKNNLIE
ncbi:CheW protein [Arcobacter nitrofigilis DSM 7299]|uniref:CheW protein n=1 Tax=Arcobacter nitrofigilis (strain ATCC 33309 / DSM 7299 / CCUG 15893 / LMG 7604 / NCTC 12251 / CI) TaxID=572480 RepID=D5V3C8_ARCNC|nr:chemotaxis protein CheW [Arcobacter nitrofigilis]ADG92710.1 CheW protein [Arcobacter nitrofigilis DSM 7299]